MSFYEGLERILSDICEKTGADVSLTPRGGEETAFDALWNGHTVTLYLAGSGESAARVARLVAYLLGSSREEEAEGLRTVLLGKGGKVSAFRYLAGKNSPDGPCYALEVVPDKRPEDALEHIERCIDGRDGAILNDGHISVVKFTAEGQTPFAFGEFLSRSLYEEAGIRASVGVGCETASFGEIALSYAQAVSALRMAALLGDGGEVHSYREYLLVRLLSDLPADRVRECLLSYHIEGQEEVFEEGELFSTAEMFLEKDLNLSETSRALFIHRNTLAYRLDKIERLTGLDIRKFSDAVTFRVLTALLKLAGE